MNLKSEICGDTCAVCIYHEGITLSAPLGGRGGPNTSSLSIPCGPLFATCPIATIMTLG